MEASKDIQLQDVHAAIREVESAIAALETQITALEAQLHIFESQLWAVLHQEIQQVQYLTKVYKSLKKEKKEKRQAQKKKGKNYKELPATQHEAYVSTKDSLDDLLEQQELRKLYKESIVKVHPDKYAQASEGELDKAQTLSTSVIALYKSKDLEGLRDLHAHIISGNAWAYQGNTEVQVRQPQHLLSYLQKKRDECIRRVQELQDNSLMEVLQTYPEPLSFVEEFRAQLLHRVAQLKKRTRKAKDV